MGSIALTVLFAPIVGSLFVALFGAKEKTIITGIVASSLLGISMISALIVLFYLLTGGQPLYLKLFDWISLGGVSIPFGILVDSVSATMMVVVTVVSTMVHIYSIGYMKHDKGFNRFFSYLSAFVFSMLILVMSDNFAGLFIGWEGVGLCSWLLIGFWYHKESASWAANEAFIMNRIADLGMLVGIFIIYWTFGTLQYQEVFAQVSGANSYILTLIAIFLFIGAMGKSAQFPLHTWLADAMEGPTPVSALIHAATMVTAGVYLVIRANEIYSLVPDVGYFIACLGAFVAMFAATMALVNRDLKRIIAYSTLSQLGYMFVAAGLGAYWIALFHLMTHAFFKSLLFLGAGNVMHAMHDELDIKKMGGLYKPLKTTAILMTLASIALAGIYPFAGFFSKDKILEVAFADVHFGLWFVLLITAGLTAFYSFRLVMLVFFGEEKYKEEHPNLHPHEAYKYMLYAMMPLAFLAVTSGWIEHGFLEFVKSVLPGKEPHVGSMTFAMLVAIALITAGSGIGFAVYKYSKGGFNKNLENTFIYKLLFNQYYIPKLYDELFSKPYAEMSHIAWKQFDVKIVDATVDMIAKTIYATGDKSRAIQSGNLSKMLRWMLIGIILLLIVASAFSLAR